MKKTELLLSRYPSAVVGGSPSSRQQYHHSRKSRSRERPDAASAAAVSKSAATTPTSPVGGFMGGGGLLPPNAATASIDSERIRFVRTPKRMESAASEKPGSKRRDPDQSERSQKYFCRERERELEKIHRRSRELMLSPRFHDSMVAREVQSTVFW